MDKKEKVGLTLPRMLFKGSFVHNPVLTQSIGICTIVAICFTLKISLIVSITLTFILLINEIMASLILKKLSRWMRIICYMLLSTLLLIPIMLILDKNYSQLNASMGIYLPLLAVNSLIVIRCEKYAVKNNLKLSVFDALSAGLGYGVTAIIIGGIREIAAFGTLMGKTVTELPGYSGMALPFGGLIVLGFTAAFHKWFVKKYFSDQPTNTFPLRTAFETPLIREEGLNITTGTLSILSDPAVTKEEALSEKTEKDASEKAPVKTEENAEKDGDNQ